MTDIEKTLIIYAHPNPQSGNCAQILSDTISYMEGNHFDYNLVDLHKDNFDPVLREDELYTAGGKNIAEQTKKYQNLFAEANKIIIIHPVWWGGMPAILKGFFDKVLTPGFGYRYRYGIPQKLFKGKKALVFQTTGGPWWWAKVVQGDRAGKNLTKDILGFLGVNTKVYLITNSRRVTDDRKKVINKIVKNKLQSFLRK